MSELECAAQATSKIKSQKNYFNKDNVTELKAFKLDTIMTSSFLVDTSTSKTSLLWKTLKSSINKESFPSFESNFSSTN